MKQHNIVSLAIIAGMSGGMLMGFYAERSNHQRETIQWSGQKTYEGMTAKFSNGQWIIYSSNSIYADSIPRSSEGARKREAEAYRLSSLLTNAPITQAVCCDKWSTHVPVIDSALVLAQSHGYRHGNDIVFQYCPWCGRLKGSDSRLKNLREWTDRSDTSSATVYRFFERPIPGTKNRVLMFEKSVDGGPFELISTNLLDFESR